MTSTVNKLKIFEKLVKSIFVDVFSYAVDYKYRWLLGAERIHITNEDIVGFDIVRNKQIKPLEQITVRIVLNKDQLNKCGDSINALIDLIYKSLEDGVQLAQQYEQDLFFSLIKAKCNKDCDNEQIRDALNLMNDKDLNKVNKHQWGWMLLENARDNGIIKENDKEYYVSLINHINYTATEDFFKQFKNLLELKDKNGN